MCLKIRLNAGERRLGFEVKLTDAPRVSPSIRSPIEFARFL
jgi:hypothetical protein